MRLRSTHRFWLCSALAALVCLLPVIGTRLKAQPDVPPADSRPPADFRFGFQMFQLLLEEPALSPKPVPKRGLLPGPSRANENTLIVVLGEMPRGMHFFNMWQDIKDRVEGGASLLVATDRGDNGYLGHFGVQLARGPVKVALPEFAYEKKPDFPLVQVTDHPVFAADEPRRQIVSNKPGFVVGLGITNVIARLPDVRHAGEVIPHPAFVLAREFDNGGRLLVTADHSLFINEMLLKNDIGNLQFAQNTIKWLVGESDRKHLLLIIDGDPVEQSIVTGVSLEDGKFRGELPAEALVAIANRAIQELEDQDKFNEILANQPAWMDPAEFRQAIMILVTASLLAFVMFWLLVTRANPRRRNDPTNPLPLQARRQKEVILEEHFGEVAQWLARAFFDTVGGQGNAAPRWVPWSSAARTRRSGSRLTNASNVRREPDLRASDVRREPDLRRKLTGHPVVEIDAGWFAGWRVWWKVGRLWKLARAAVVYGINARRLRRIRRDIRRLHYLFAHGRLAIRWFEGRTSWWRLWPPMWRYRYRKEPAWVLPVTQEPTGHKTLQAVQQLRRKTPPHP